MTPTTISIIIILYFGVLITISYLTSKNADNETFFMADKKSPWYLVAFGMIGASLSGITFISIPGGVGNEAKQFGYMQMVFGYFFGYLIIAYVLMPIYYKMNLTSIYSYLRHRFGKNAHQIGAFYFILSRVTGASIRLLLVANVLQEFVFKQMEIPFEVTVLISILLIWIYTSKGGMKTIIWTDTLQTAFMLLSLIFTVVIISSMLDFKDAGIFQSISNSNFSKMFFLEDINAGNHFFKMFFGGIFITVGMTGLDQDMMQKNLSCKNIKEAQKNMISFAALLVLVNFIFLCLGALLYLFIESKGISSPKNSDLLFPTLALGNELGITVGILFLLGLIAAAYSSADSALTSLTTSICIDFILPRSNKKNINIHEMNSNDIPQKTRRIVHLIVSFFLFVTIILLNLLLTENAIWQLITLAGYTYGPLIGLFFYGILTKNKLNDKLIPIICVIAPIITYLINNYSVTFKFGGALIIVNTIITFLGLHILFLISNRTVKQL